MSEMKLVINDPFNVELENYKQWIACPHCGLGQSIEIEEAVLDEPYQEDVTVKCEECGSFFEVAWTPTFTVRKTGGKS